MSSKAREIAGIFQKERFATKRELTLMSRLCAEISAIFPVEFSEVSVQYISNKVKDKFH